MASALAINARCCIPPESVRNGASARDASPTVSIARLTIVPVARPKRSPRSADASRPAETISRTVTGVPEARCARWGR